MSISAKSQLMKNQVHAVPALPHSRLHVMQTGAGTAVVFSFNYGGLYMTREVVGTKSGWKRTNMTEDLEKMFPGRSISFKGFSVTQNSYTSAFDMALVLTVNEKIGPNDLLFLSMNNPDEQSFWDKEKINWQGVPMEGMPPNWRLRIVGDPKLLNYPNADEPSKASFQCCFVYGTDYSNTGISALTLFRIDMRYFPRWTLVLGADTMFKDRENTVPANKFPRHGGPGLYRLAYGQNWDTTKIQYVSWYSTLSQDPAKPVQVTPFAVPDNQTVIAIASAPNQAGLTNFYASTRTGVYLWRPLDQVSHVQPPKILDSILFKGRNIFDSDFDKSKLVVSMVDTRTVLFWKNAARELYYFSCPFGDEETLGAWSEALPIYTEVEDFDMYVNHVSGSINVIAHISGGQQLEKLTQDPSTTAWTTHPINLPAIEAGHRVELTTYTTTIRVTSALPSVDATQSVSIRAAETMSAYVNGEYHVLHPNKPLTVQSGVDDLVTVMQPVKNITPTAFTVVSQNSQSILVDPFARAAEKIKEIKSGPELKAVKVPDSKGVVQNLIPSGTSSESLKFAAESLVSLMKVRDSLRKDGKPTRRDWDVDFLPKVASLEDRKQAEAYDWGPAFGSPEFKFENGDSMKMPAAVLKGFPWIKAGDMFHWLRKGFKEVEQFACHEVQEGWAFTIHLAGTAFHAIIDSTSAVVGAVEFVFQKLQAAAEYLISWLGFLFEWPSILRTHRVMRSITKAFMVESIRLLETGKEKVESGAQTLERELQNWANLLPDEKDPVKKDVEGADEPQAQWAVQHVNAGKSEMSSKDPTVHDISNALEQLMQNFVEFFDGEEKAVLSAIEELYTEVFLKLGQISAIDAVKKSVAILGDLVVKTFKNGLILLIDIAEIIAKLIMDFLTTPLNIPVISSFYKDVITQGKDELTILDLVCLLGAIPATVIYKAATRSEPFASGRLTDDLIAITTFKDLITVIKSNTSVPDQNSAVTNLKLPTILRSVCLFANAGFLALSGIAQAITFKDAPAPNKSFKKVLRIAQCVNCLTFFVVGLPPLVETAVLMVEKGSSDAPWYFWVNLGIGLGGLAKGVLMAILISKDSPWAKSKFPPWGDCVLGLGRLGTTVTLTFLNPSDYKWPRRILDCIPAVARIGLFVFAAHFFVIDGDFILEPWAADDATTEGYRLIELGSAED